MASRHAQDGDRLLRVWTPRLLRATLAASMLLLAAGVCVVAATAPSSYVAGYEALRSGTASSHPEPPAQLLRELLHGQGRALLVAGLLVLTLVPIGRVAFTVVVFVRERDWLFAAITALVLALLCVGVALGHVG